MRRKAVSIPSLAGQTARPPEPLLVKTIVQGSSFNPLISGADRAAKLADGADIQGRAVSIPSLAGQTARLRVRAFSPRPHPRFNPLISGADRAAQPVLVLR